MALTVGYSERINVNATIHRVINKAFRIIYNHLIDSFLILDVWATYPWMEQFSDNFDVMLFHYDGRTTEWDEFEWSKQAVHVSAWEQAKWSVPSSLVVWGASMIMQWKLMQGITAPEFIRV